MIQSRSYGIATFLGNVWIALYDGNRIVCMDENENEIKSYSMSTPHGMFSNEYGIIVSTYHGDSLVFLAPGGGNDNPLVVPMNGKEPISSCQWIDDVYFADYQRNKIYSQSGELFLEVSMPHMISPYDDMLLVSSRRNGVLLVSPKGKIVDKLTIAKDPVAARYIHDTLYIADYDTKALMNKNGKVIATGPIMDFCELNDKLYLSLENGANTTCTY